MGVRMNRQEQERYLRLLNEQCRRKHKYNIFNFIKDAVHIEDKTKDDIVQPFQAWPKQLEVFDQLIEERFNIILKARQLGISWVVLIYAMWRIVNFMGYTVVTLSKSEVDAKELVRRMEFILRWMPEWIIRPKDNKKEGLPYWEATAMTITIHQHDGEISVFNVFTAGKNSGRSFTADLVILDEWAFQQFAREIWNAAFPTINRPVGGQVIGLSTAARMTLFEEIWEKAEAGLNRFKPIFLSWRADPRRDDEWYEATKQDMGEHDTKVEYPSTPTEAFEAATGAAFPEFSRKIHVCKSHPLPRHWKRWVSIDNGYADPFAWYWFAVDEQGHIHVYREYTREDEDEKVTYSDQARKAVLLTVGEHIGATVVGHDAYAKQGARFGVNKTLLDYYKDGGWKDNFVKSNIDRAMRKGTINEYLKPYFDENDNTYKSRIIIHDCCDKLIETLPKLLTDEKDNEKVAECKIDHWFDSFGYGLILWNSNTSLTTSKPKTLEESFFSKKPESNNVMGTEVDDSFLNFGGDVF